MRRNLLGLIGAFVTLSVVYMTAGFVFLDGADIFGPSLGGPLVLPVVGFAISNALYVLFYSWVVKQMGSALKAALTVAVSQLLLVNVDYVLAGDRTVAGGVVSSIVLLVGWILVGVVYQTVVQRGEPKLASA